MLAPLASLVHHRNRITDVKKSEIRLHCPPSTPSPKSVVVADSARVPLLPFLRSFHPIIVSSRRNIIRARNSIIRFNITKFMSLFCRVRAFLVPLLILLVAPIPHTPSIFFSFRHIARRLIVVNKLHSVYTGSITYGEQE